MHGKILNRRCQILFNSLPQFRSCRLSCFSHLFFISLVTLSLILFLYTSNGYSAQVTLAWDPNSEKDLAGYKVYYGYSSRNYNTIVDVASQTSYTISNLVDGNTYFIAVTAYNINGNESGYSNEANYTPSGNQEPNGVIDTPVGNQTINIGDSVNFTGTGTDPDNNLPLTYLWNFDVGSRIPDSTVEDPGSVQFNNSGVFTVTFTVTDSLGLADSTPATRTITVSSGVSESLISNLTATSGENYEIIKNGLQNGALVHIDRRDTFSNVPTWLEGTTYIKTAERDKKSSGASFLTFDVNQDVTVYVAHDNLIKKKPSWLVPFTDTGDDIVTTNTTLSIFASYYLAGTVTLGGNEGGKRSSMYTVIVVEQ